MTCTAICQVSSPSNGLINPAAIPKVLADGSPSYPVRFRTADGQQRSKAFNRLKDAEHHARTVEVERSTGSLVDPRDGRETLDDLWTRWWPTVTGLRPSTLTRDETYYRNHIRPAFGTTPLSRIDRAALNTWVTELDGKS